MSNVVNAIQCKQRVAQVVNQAEKQDNVEHALIRGTEVVNAATLVPAVFDLKKIARPAVSGRIGIIRSERQDFRRATPRTLKTKEAVPGSDVENSLALKAIREAQVL